MRAVDRAVGAWKRFAGSLAQAYARRRGITDDQAAVLRLGYWRGRWGKEDSEWLTFPLRCPVNGRPVGVYGRNLHADDQHRKARVMGPRGLFGSARPDPLPDDLILVEGAFEALAILQSPGLLPVRAVVGASARAEWFDHCRRVVILFDDDNAGREATNRLVDELNARRLRRNAGPRILCLKPETLAQEHGCKDLGALLERGIPVTLNLPPLESPVRTTAAPAWNDGHAFDLLSAAVADLGEQLPAGSLELAEVYWPDELAALDQAEADVNAAYAAADSERFSAALAAFANATTALRAALTPA